jgi:hypothetical protein
MQELCIIKKLIICFNVICTNKIIRKLENEIRKTQNSSESKGKKSFVIRIDESTYKLLEKWANDEFRSVNGQIEYLLHQSLVNSGRKKKGINSKEISKGKSFEF